MGILEIEDLHFCYSKQEMEVLKGISLNVEEGEFLVLCGASGCGKSTFLRQLKPVLSPYGKMSGEIRYQGKNILDVKEKKLASEIGFVMQNVNQQIVTEKVWHELAFGLESLGFAPEIIRRKVAEMAAYFGMEELFHEKVNRLSGGQKQLLNLASVMVMNPRILILDEPTSQLDPITTSDFLGTVKKINRDLGVTVIITEHRLQEIFPMADRVIVMDHGRILFCGTPEVVGNRLKEEKHEMYEALPAPLQIYSSFCHDGKGPLTVRDGRKWLNQYLHDKEINGLGSRRNDDTQQEFEECNRQEILFCKDIWFRYEKNAPDIIKGAEIKIYNGEIFCLLGGNGAGKSTFLSILAGIKKPYRGKVFIKKKEIGKYGKKELYNGILAMVPQDPKTLFLKETVYEELKEMAEEDCEKNILDTAKLLHLDSVLERHPYDLSGGEQQRLAMGKVLLLNPEIILLDEPTKGLDSLLKKELMQILRKLQKKGITIFLVSHDIEFCARTGDRCGLFFDGSIVSRESARTFFAGNNFYTTAANRMVRHVFPEAITVQDVKICMKRENEK